MLVSKSVKPFQQANQKMHQFSEPTQTKQEITNTCLEAASAPCILARKRFWGVGPPSFLPRVQRHPLDFSSPSSEMTELIALIPRGKKHQGKTWREALGEWCREGGRLASQLTRGLQLPPPFLFYLEITSNFQKDIRVWHFSGNKYFNLHCNKNFSWT